MIELGLLIVVCLSIDNPSKKCIIVPFINKVTFAMYVVTLNFCYFHVFKKKNWIAMIICVLPIPTSPLANCNN